MARILVTSRGLGDPREFVFDPRSERLETPLFAPFVARRQLLAFLRRSASDALRWEVEAERNRQRARRLEMEWQAHEARARRAGDWARPRESFFLMAELEDYLLPAEHSSGPL